MLWYSPADQNPQTKIECDYAFNFTLALAKKIKVQIGIAAEDYAWKKTYGSENSCTQFSGVYPLFYLGN
jgi:hypothetical protein